MTTDTPQPNFDVEGAQRRTESLLAQLPPRDTLPFVPGLAELMEERKQLRRDLKARLFMAYYGIDPELTRQAAQKMRDFQDETDRLRCELTGEDPAELKREREERTRAFKALFDQEVAHIVKDLP